MIAPEDIPLSNHATDAAANQLGTPSLVIRSDGTPSNTHIALTDGTKLGLIQSVTWGLTLQGYSTAIIETLATPSDLKVLAKHTTVMVRPAPGYHPFRYLWDWYAAKVGRWLNEPSVKASAKEEPTTSRFTQPST